MGNFGADESRCAEYWFSPVVACAAHGHTARRSGQLLPIVLAQYLSGPGLTTDSPMSRPPQSIQRIPDPQVLVRLSRNSRVFCRAVCLTPFSEHRDRPLPV